jgi:pimeloyl-ACP methyl ester carboxylesterase
MDLSRIGIFGQSMGGMTAQKCILVEPRLAAGISFDPGPIRENLTDSTSRPFMFLQAEPGFGASESAFSRCRVDAYYGVINGTLHFDFSDLGLWFTRKPLWRLMKCTGKLDGYRCHELLNACTVAFFDRYLKNADSDIQSAVKAFPELQLRVKNVRK